MDIHVNNNSPEDDKPTTMNEGNIHQEFFIKKKVLATKIYFIICFYLNKLNKSKNLIVYTCMFKL